MGQQKLYFIERYILFWFKHSAKESNTSELSIAKWHAKLSHANCEKNIEANCKSSNKNFSLVSKVHWPPISVLRVQNVRYLRLTYPKTLKATRKLELVHSDVCGPFPESLHGNK